MPVRYLGISRLTSWSRTGIWDNSIHQFAAIGTVLVGTRRHLLRERSPGSREEAELSPEAMQGMNSLATIGRRRRTWRDILKRADTL
jgi:hypothetical protein